MENLQTAVLNHDDTEQIPSGLGGNAHANSI
jgi:hypothetical protein